MDYLKVRDLKPAAETILYPRRLSRGDFDKILGIVNTLGDRTRDVKDKCVEHLALIE